MKIRVEDVGYVVQKQVVSYKVWFNPLNAKLNPICHLLALLGAHPILHVSRVRVNVSRWNGRLAVLNR